MQELQVKALGLRDHVQASEVLGVECLRGPLDLQSFFDAVPVPVPPAGGIDVRPVFRTAGSCRQKGSVLNLSKVC
jgi:hypothetical protein